MPLPPDRSHVTTEHRPPAGEPGLDALATIEAVGRIAREGREAAARVDQAAARLAGFIDGLVPRLARGGRLIYVGAGTSGRLGVLDASECPPTFGTDPEQVLGVIAGGQPALTRSSEAREDEAGGAEAELSALDVGPRDSVLAIAAGGTTPFALGALPIAKARGAMTGLLTCARIAEAPPACDHLIGLDTGPELLTGSTRLKAGTATKIALNAITTIAFARLGHMHGDLMVNLRATNDKLLDRALRILVAVCPSLDREGAHRLLGRAGGELKVAIVMERAGLDAEAAVRVLEEAAGLVRRCVSDQTPMIHD